MAKAWDDSAGKPVIVDQEFVIGGFERAYDRFGQELTRRDPDAPGAIYRSLFETLAWTSSLDERLAFPDQPELRGLRFARNRVHHQWANALFVSGGRTFPLTFPMVFYEWRWRSLLPAGRPSRDEPAYMERLAEKPARVTLAAVADFFAAQ